MADMSTPPDPTTEPDPLFCARLTAITRDGAYLGLALNDILIAVNGVPFAHPKADLPRALSQLVRGRAALTFRRDNDDFTVIATTPALGAWDPEPAMQSVVKKRISAAALTNWEIYTCDDGTYDLQPMSPSLLALIAAPLWLAQARLWIPLATIMSVTIITSPFGFFMASAVYGLASVYVWRMSQTLFRADREGKGYERTLVMAAPSETAVHEYLNKWKPELAYVHAIKASKVAAE